MDYDEVARKQWFKDPMSESIYKETEEHLAKNPNLSRVNISSVRNGDRLIFPADFMGGFPEMEVLVLVKMLRENDQTPLHVKLFRNDPMVNKELEAINGIAIMYVDDNEYFYKWNE